ncbi:MAG: Rrf2 family transcriptional regulator [Bacteroidales bacterium]
MDFSKTTSYAITVLNYLAKNGEKRFTAKELNQELDIPWQYLRRLLTNLSKDGFIEGVKGRTGGFSLARNPREITIASIVESTEGMAIFNKCIMGFHECPSAEKCVMHDTWEQARDNIVSLLQNTTLDKFKGMR